jgi:hypothetical protein
LAEIDAEPRHLRKVRARVLGVDHNGGGPTIALLREQGEQFAFRVFGKIANGAPRGEAGSINDELPRRADTLLDRLHGRSRAQGEQADYEQAEKRGLSHEESASQIWPRLREPKAARKIFLFQRN